MVVLSRHALTFLPFMFWVYSVKLRIKSFKVPELFVEIPTTATVGSLKVCNIAFSSVQSYPSG